MDKMRNKYWLITYVVFKDTEKGIEDICLVQERLDGWWMRWFIQIKKYQKY